MNSASAAIVLDKPGLTALRGKEERKGSQIFRQVTPIS